MKIQVPVAIGLLVCENVIVEEDTKNVTPVNCFTHRQFDAFPAEPMQVVVLAFLTNGFGEMPLDAIVQSLDNGEENERRRTQAVFKSPLHEYRYVFRMRRFSVPQPGHYQISLIAEGEVLAHRKLIFAEKKA